MKKLILQALLIAVSCIYFTPAPSSAAEPASSTDTWLQGAAGYERAIQLQQERNVPMVVYFWAEWCPYCKALDTRYLPTAPVQEYLREVIKVRIEPEQGRAERQLAKQYNVKGYPAFYIIPNSAAKPVKIHPFSRSRSWTPEEFVEACQKAGPVPGDSAARRNSQTPGSIIERQPEIKAPSVSTKRSTSGGVIITVVPTVKTSPK